MKIVATLLVLLASADSESYGYYKFYKNFGGGFYDYGGGRYNAWNGSSPDPDAKDALCTDRGVYFDGTRDYVTVHSYSSSSAPIFSMPLEFNLWVMITKTQKCGILRRSYAVSSEQFKIHIGDGFKIANSFYITSDSGITSDLIRLKATDSFNLTQSWYFVRLVYDQPSSFQATLEINGVLQSSYSDDSKVLFEKEPGTTLLNDGGRSMEGFIYLLNIFRPDSFDHTVYFSSICTPNLNSCTSCPFGECLSESSDPLQNNNGDLCSSFGCSSSCDREGNCLDCALSSWPVCDLSSSVPDLCDSSCNGCTLTSSSDCLECSNNLLTILSVPGPCECLSTDLYDCGLCSSDCGSCLDSTLCDSCIDPLAIPKLDGTGGCECPQRTYFETSCKSKFYTVCHEDCLECSQANLCNTCADSLAVPKSDGTAGCECPQGTYFDTSCKCDSYVVCHRDCLECSESNSCISCKIQDAVPNKIGLGCACPLNSSLVEDACECGDGYFKLEGKCEECSTNCSKCTERGCSECLFEYATINEHGMCQCPGNFVENIEESRCECTEGFYKQENGECFECKTECNTCSEGDSCLSCKDPNAYIQEEKCECPENSHFKDGYCVCKDSFYTSSDPFQCTKEVEILEEIFKGFSSIKSTCVTVTSLIFGLIALIMKSPMSIWSFFNTVQFLSYVPLMNIDFPSQIEYITSSFDLRAYIPNIIVLLGHNDSPLNIDKPHWEEFTDTSCFSRNIGEFITSFGISLAILIIGKIILLITPPGENIIREKLSVFRYTAFIRLFTEFYLLLVFGAIISFSKLLDNETKDTDYYVGSGVLGLCMIAPFGMAGFLYRIRRDVKDLETKRKFGTLFKEFERGDRFECLLYYPFKLAKRLLYMLSLYFFYEEPRLQVCSAFSLCLFEIILIKEHIRFKGKWRQRLEILTQANLGVFFLLTLSFDSDLTKSQKDTILIVMIGLVCIILSLNTLYYALKLFRTCKKEKRSKKENRGKVIPLANIIEERVFEFSRNNLPNDNMENDNQVNNTNIIT